MAEKGNPASVSDVGVGALATRACIEGAAMNVRINLGQLKDEKFKIDASRTSSKDQRGFRDAVQEDQSNCGKQTRLKREAGSHAVMFERSEASLDIRLRAGCREILRSVQNDSFSVLHFSDNES